MRELDYLARALVIVGGLNWGPVSIGEFDLVAMLFDLDYGETNASSRIVYGLADLAALYGVGSLLAPRPRPEAARGRRPATVSR